MLTPELDHAAAIITAVEDVLSLDSDVWLDNARHFTETEVRAISGLLFVGGLEGTAILLLQQWIEHEIADGEVVAGDFTVDEEHGTLVDHREVDID